MCSRSLQVKYEVKESDIREIRKLLKSYVTRLENKDAAAKTTKEWRIVARVLDRIFFFCYIGTIVVSLFTIFPRDGGEREHVFTVTTPAPAEAVTEDVYVEPVTVSDLSFAYDDYNNVDYRWPLLNFDYDDKRNVI